MIGSGKIGILLVVLINSCNTHITVTTEYMCWNQGLNHSLILFSNMFSSTLQWMVNYSTDFSSNQMNIHKIKLGKGIKIFALAGSGQIYKCQWNGSFLWSHDENNFGTNKYGRVCPLLTGITYHYWWYGIFILRQGRL